MHINLIYKDEQRSASPVSFGLMMRVVIGAVLFLIVFGVVMFFVGYSSIKHQVNALDNEWKYAVSYTHLTLPTTERV